jgi:hypothetical protein
VRKQTFLVKRESIFSQEKRGYLFSRAPVQKVILLRKRARQKTSGRKWYAKHHSMEKYA